MILPWLRLQKVDVEVEELSDRVIRLHFKYTSLPHGAAPRFSDSPLREWHSFAGIPELNGVGFSILVSKAGDWTSKIIANPPKQLWTKGLPIRGVLHMAPIFKRIVILTTGSGIGPVLSLQHVHGLEMRVIWSTPDPINTFKSKIIDQVHLIDQDAIIIDTHQAGRPDLVFEGYKLYKSSHAEAVFVISNQEVTTKVVHALKCHSIPVFAPIFDS